MKIILLTIFSVLTLGIAPNAFSGTLEIFTDNQVYTHDQPLFVYGTVLPDETLVIRLFAPDGTISEFDQVTAGMDGTFEHVLTIWPKSTTNFAYGTYSVEVISGLQEGLSKRIDVKFVATSELKQVPIERQLQNIVFAPETGAINNQFRVFTQVTSDGLLLGGDPQVILGRSHVHVPTGQLDSLLGQFQTLHQGLYFIDYLPKLKGTYVFHIVAFSQGTVSHGSAATQILSQDIGGISEQIIQLNKILEETSDKLEKLKSETEGFGANLQEASTNIDKSVSAVSSSVSNIEEASVQLNSLFFPIVGSIGIIVALQIAILARRR